MEQGALCTDRFCYASALHPCKVIAICGGQNVCPPKVVCQNPHPQWDGISKGVFGGSLGHEGGTLMNGVSVLE